MTLIMPIDRSYIRTASLAAEDLYQEFQEHGFDEDVARENDMSVFEGEGSRGIMGILGPFRELVVKYEDLERKEEIKSAVDDYSSQNETEVRAWMQSELDGTSEEFAPIDSARKDYNWILMERAETLSEEPDLEAVHSDQWSMPGEPPEFGLFNGKRRSIDYGTIEHDSWDISDDPLSEEDLDQVYGDNILDKGEYVVITQR